MTEADLPSAQFGRLKTEDGFIIHRQGDSWLIWNETYWPKGMYTYNGPKLSRWDSVCLWAIQKQLGPKPGSSTESLWGEPMTAHSLDTAIEYAKALVKADYYDFLQARLKNEIERVKIECSAHLPQRLIEF